MYCASEVERSDESAEIVDLHVRRLVRAFVDCNSWLRIFTISLNKMTMGNRKTTTVFFSLFERMTCRCFVIVNRTDLANEVIFLETAIKFGSFICLLFLTVFESQTVWIKIRVDVLSVLMFAKTKVCRRYTIC